MTRSIFKAMQRIALSCIALPALAGAAYAQSYFECREFDGRTATRVIGGAFALIEDFPWMASLSIRRPGGIYMCGGSVLNPRWILTAAHCVVENAHGTNIPLGNEQVTIRHNSGNFGAGGQTHETGAMFIHPAYSHDPSGTPYDIALIKLAEPLLIENRRQAVQLQGPALADRLASPGSCATVLGWGQTESGTTSDTLLQASLPIARQEDCAAAHPGRIDASVVCAGLEAGGRDSCGGDSGGPLVVFGGPTGWTQVGIVSWGLRPCGRPGDYGVYTRVSHYIDWIQSTINAN